MGGDRYCGFCGKHETEVARLIAGPIANICNECVELQHGMLNEDPSRKRSLHEVLSRARQRRISELEAENRRMREALDLFWSQSLAIETLARRAYGESSQIYQNVLAAILK